MPCKLAWTIPRPPRFPCLSFSYRQALRACWQRPPLQLLLCASSNANARECASSHFQGADGSNLDRVWTADLQICMQVDPGAIVEIQISPDSRVAQFDFRRWVPAHARARLPLPCTPLPAPLWPADSDGVPCKFAAVCAVKCPWRLQMMCTAAAAAPGILLAASAKSTLAGARASQGSGQLPAGQPGIMMAVCHAAPPFRWWAMRMCCMGSSCTS